MSARPLRLESMFAFAAPPMPQTLGKYRIERVLGEGAMGIVYKAVDPLIERPVALKTIRKSLLAPHAADAADAAAAERFRKEAQAAGRLNHPGIVSVYEYGDDEGDAFIAMEYVEGVTLLDATARGVRLPLPDVLSVMLQLLDALQHAHAQGVWHRDIKPGNLIVTAEGRLKVTDFGIARIDTASETQKTTVLGSPGYMAPERYTGEPPDARVDIFSCGVLLYELLTGAPPFLGTSNAVMYQVLHVDPPAPSRAPVGEPAPTLYDAIVARAIAKRPQDRYESVPAMRDALVAAFAEPIAATLSADAVARLQSARTTAGPRDGASASAPASAPAAAAAAASASAPAPWCDVETLRRLETLLLPHLGPVAKPVVRRTSRECGGVAALVSRLARDWIPADERNAFMARAAASLATARANGSSPPLLIPVLGATPLLPDLVDKARRVLAFHVGPIASVITRNAAAHATTREQFFAALADAAADSVDRESLLAGLNRLS